MKRAAVKEAKRVGIGDLVRIATIVVGVLAVAQELRKPRGEREWHGAVGPVPYDFRKPTLDRLRSRMWSPESPLIQPRAFGVGWTLNLGRAVAALRRQAH